MSWPAFDPPPAAAFVDVDGTLLAETTSFLFAQMLRRRGLLRGSFLLRAAYHGLQHRLGRLDYARLVEYGLRTIGRIPVVDLERMAYENFAQNVKPRLYPGVVDHLDGLRRAGAELVLVSSSPGIVIEPLALYLKCAATLTTPVRIERGRMLGLGHGPPCYGEGKRHWAADWAASNRVDLADCVAYADNWSDRPLLLAVGRAAVVHPGPRLRRLAVDRGWAIVRPRRPRPDDAPGPA